MRLYDCFWKNFELIFWSISQIGQILPFMFRFFAIILSFLAIFGNFCPFRRFFAAFHNFWTFLNTLIIWSFLVNFLTWLIFVALFGHLGTWKSDQKWP